MSKYIPTDNKPEGQVKPKLKVKVRINEEDRTLNEYDVFQMLSDLNNRQVHTEKLIQEIGQALQGVIDGMKAGVKEEQTVPTIDLPGLKKVEDDDVSVNLVN